MVLCYNKNMRRVFASFVSVMLVLFLPASVYALPESDYKYYSDNNFLFWDPEAGSSFGRSCIGDNKSYDGREVWGAGQLEAIAANQTFYEEAAAEYDLPWQILAVIHSQENSLRRSNPVSSWDASKSEGAYQLHSWAIAGKVNYVPATSLTDAEFLQQTKDAARFITETYSDLDLSTDDGIKTMLYRYNGTGYPYYHDKAIALGFGEDGAARGEGSVYVMNRYDAQRDPLSGSMNPVWPGRYVGDGKYDAESTTEVYGTFVKYLALGGASAFCGSGGLDINAAQELVNYYKEQAIIHQFDRNNVALDGAILYYYPSCNGALTNCVAFSQWFITKYTTAGNLGLPDGRKVAGMLAGKYGFSDLQSEPRAFAIFSRLSGGNGHGHTGVVLGVDEANDQMIIGEAGCGSSIDFIGAKVVKMSDMISSDYEYVYTDAILMGL